MEERLSPTELEDLSAYLDGELAEADRARVEGLLKTRAAWRQAMDGLRAVDRALDAYVAPPAPAGLAQRVLRHVAAAGRRAPLIRPSLRWLVPLAAAASILASFLVYRTFVAATRQKATMAHRPVPTRAAPPAPRADSYEIVPGLEDEQEFPEMAGRRRAADDRREYPREGETGVGYIDPSEPIEDPFLYHEGT